MSRPANSYPDILRNHRSNVEVASRLHFQQGLGQRIAEYANAALVGAVAESVNELEEKEEQLPSWNRRGVVPPSPPIHSHFLLQK